MTCTYAADTAGYEPPVHAHVPRARCPVPRAHGELRRAGVPVDVRPLLREAGAPPSPESCVARLVLRLTPVPRSRVRAQRKRSSIRRTTRTYLGALAAKSDPQTSPQTSPRAECFRGRGAGHLEPLDDPYGNAVLTVAWFRLFLDRASRAGDMDWEELVFGFCLTQSHPASSHATGVHNCAASTLDTPKTTCRRVPEIDVPRLGWPYVAL
jgi:hypothetical protein